MHLTLLQTIVLGLSIPVAYLLPIAEAFTNPSKIYGRGRSMPLQTATCETTRLVVNDGARAMSGSRLNAGFSDAWNAYNAALESDPLIVKSVTASVILGLGDFAGQAVEKIRNNSNGESNDIEKPVDFARAARFAVFGLVLQAPWNHFYYLLLDGQIPPTVEPFSSTNIVKVCIDQFIQAPIFTVLIFAFLGALEGKGFEDIKKQLENDYPETIVANCEFLSPSDTIIVILKSHVLNLLSLCRETMGSRHDHQYWVRPPSIASALSELCVFLLVNLSIASPQQG